MSTELPDELARLQQLLEDKDREILTLNQTIALLRSQLFGKSSEKRTPEDERQALIFNEAEDGAGDDTPRETSVIASYLRGKRGRRPISKDLPREDVVLDLPETEKTCACGHEMTHIGDDVSEELDIIPQKIKVNRIIQRKYACKHCEGLSDETRPAVRVAARHRMLPSTIAGEGLLAYIFTAKFCDALPFYRQEKMFQRIGVDLTRATMCNWAIQAVEELAIVRRLLWDELRSSVTLGIDETTIQVIREQGRAADQKSYIWAFRGGVRDRPVILFDYRQSRSAAFLAERLSGFQGSIMTDDFSSYGHLDSMPGVVRAACWAHVRRRFVEVEKLQGRTERTGWILGRIQSLYRIEAETRELPPEKRRKQRQLASAPIIEEIQSWLQEQRSATLPSGAMGRAIVYALKLWPRLTVFLGRGEIEIDNNLTENAIRPFVVGRKNWLFSFAPEGAAASALLYSLIETAKANGHEPYAYLKYLFSRFPAVRNDVDEIGSLLPCYVSPETVRRGLKPG